jgi:ATP-dependent helicase HepA
MLDTASEFAGERSKPIIAAAAAKADEILAASWQRLVDLRKVNDHIREAEVTLAQQRRETMRTAICGARLRLDSLRLILEGPAGGFEE